MKISWFIVTAILSASSHLFAAEVHHGAKRPVSSATLISASNYAPPYTPVIEFADLILLLFDPLDAAVQIDLNDIIIRFDAAADANVLNAILNQP